MVDWPWQRGRDRDADDEEYPDSLVVCRFQDGTLVVYGDRVVVERPGRSRFDDVEIPLAEVVGVDYDEGITVGYLQVERQGVDPDRGGLLSDPVNERTVHFGRGGRRCAREARDAILERADG
jgi:hypothetical protein